MNLLYQVNRNLRNMDRFLSLLFTQVNLYTLLNKFNAVSEKEYKTYKENFMKRFEITELPPYLILYIKVSIILVCVHVRVLDVYKLVYILYSSNFFLLSEIH